MSQRDESKSGGTDNTKFVNGLYSKFYYTNTYTNTNEDYKNPSTDNLLLGQPVPQANQENQPPFTLEQTSNFSNIKERRVKLNNDSDSDCTSDQGEGLVQRR